jgi:hypothetical protein
VGFNYHLTGRKVSTKESLAGDGERRVRCCEIRDGRFSFLGGDAAGDQFTTTLLIP